MTEVGTPKQRAGHWIAIVTLTAAIAFFAGFSIGRPDDGLAAPTSSTSTRSAGVVGVGSGVPADVSVPADFKQFWDLWKELKERYYKQPVEDSTLFYGAMSGLASSLGDPYTVFLEPSTAEQFSQALQGKFEGIGAEIGIKDDQLQIIAPLPGTPADRAGLRAGDLILSIDKKDTFGMSVDQAVLLIRGKKGTVVNLQIGRVTVTKDEKGKEKKDLQTLDVPITRDVIVVKSVNVSYPAEKIARIEISHFNQDTSDLFQQAVVDVLTKDVKGIILDLRNNPGGYLDRATYIASEWVGDKVVVIERRQSTITERYKGTASGRLNGIPTVVLVNEGSASASEIVAGALQDYKKATIVGMKTFGKGSVQDYNEFPDRSSYKITIAEWLTPNERSIDGVGIEPDIAVDRTQEDYNANRDPQLDKAIEILTGKPTSTTSTLQTP